MMLETAGIYHSMYTHVSLMDTRVKCDGHERKVVVLTHYHLPETFLHVMCHH
jgi:hypothetical protein